MKHASHVLILTSFAVALYGCRSNQVLSSYDPVLAKIVLHPAKGDVLRWKDTMVQFSDKPNLNPCKGNPVQTSECEIGVDRGSYVYDCIPADKCQDPEVEVGTETVPPLEDKVLERAKGRTRVPVFLQCENKALTLKPPSQDAYANQAVVFKAVGTDSPDDWKIHLLTSGCSGQTDFDMAHYLCNLDAPAGTTINYQASSQMCVGSATYTPGQINVK